MTAAVPVKWVKTASRRPAAMPGACQSGGCGGPDTAAPAPGFSFGAVRVNGVEIEAESIAREIQHHPAPDAEAAWIAAARALVVRELLLQEARRLEVEASPEPDEAGRIDAEEDALIRELLDRQVQAEPPTEDECRRYYASQVARFRTADLFEAAHILIEPESRDEAGWADAQGRARAIAQQVGDDAAAFAAAAREMSGCTSAPLGGSLGQVRRGELVREIQSVLEALADGTTSREPVRSRFGWHVVRLQHRSEGRVVPFEAVRNKIVDTLEARCWAIAAGRYVAALAAGARIDGVTLGDGPFVGGTP
jgi:peptidyl-prolyl cis-trans isomerase C